MSNTCGDDGSPDPDVLVYVIHPFDRASLFVHPTNLPVSFTRAFVPGVNVPKSGNTSSYVILLLLTGVPALPARSVPVIDRVYIDPFTNVVDTLTC